MKYKYTIRAVCAVLAAAILIVLSGLLPSTISKYDVTANRMYTLSDTSKQTLKNVKTDVTVYILTNGSDLNESLSVFAERYAKESGHVKIRYLDLTEDLPLISQYTSKSLTPNSLIVASDSHYCVIPYGELFYYTPEAYLETFNVYVSYYQSNFTFSDFFRYYAPYFPYQTLYSGFKFESVITSAIDFAAGNAKKVYFASGHGSPSPGDALVNRLCTEGIELIPFDLEAEEVPSDAEAVLLLPATDISENEKTKLTDYVSGGGDLMLLTTYGSAKPTLDSFIGSYGVTNTGGLLCDDSSGHNLVSPALIIPEVSDPDGVIEEKLRNIVGNGLFGGATGVLINERLPDNVTVTPLMTTSENAYLKKSTSNPTFDGENDERGQYHTALRIKAGDGRIIWFSSVTLINEDYNVYSTRGNEEIFSYYLNYLCENQERPVIPVKLSITESVNVKSTTVYIYLAVFACAAVGIIAFGIVRKYRRINK